MSRSFFAPEVIQTSAMDCGPAALKTLLDGHGIPSSYGRLREACQTDVDGTSIDTLEQAAVDLGLDAAQVMAPVDSVGVPEAELLPCLIVTRMPGGATHFVVAWRKHGPYLQIMDPGAGRRWVHMSEFQSHLYVHTMPIPAEAWRGWAGSDTFLNTIKAKLSAIGVGNSTFNSLRDRSLADPTYVTLSQLDGATRMATALVRSGAIGRGGEAARLVENLVQPGANIPDSYRTAKPDPANSENVIMSGAVMITVSGRKKAASKGKDGDEPQRDISPELAAALAPDKDQPARQLFRLLRADGLFSPALLLPAMALAAAAVGLESLLLRGLFDLSRELTLSNQRFAAISAFLVFLTLLLVLEWPLAASLLRIGRKLEGHLRVAFLAKIPRLGDRYFQSRLVSDMAERSHTVHTVRNLPEQFGQVLRAGFEMLFLVAAITWFYPASAIWAWGIVALAILFPALSQPVIAARDLRWRTHSGALGRFYLDALLGLVAIRAHGAERALRREQEGMLASWAEAGFSTQRAAVLLEGSHYFLSLAFAAGLLLTHLAKSNDPGGILLLAYWALNLPPLGQEISSFARNYPGQRNVTLRLLEPLGAPEEPVHDATPPAATAGAAIDLRNVTVRAAGHLILDDITLRIEPGEQIGIVGPSGAGKSSLVGLLLGWHRPAAGELLLDGEPIDAARLAAFRRQIAWIDPQVQLWNRTLIENLSYGTTPGEPLELDRALENADLRGVLRKQPEGLQSVLGESGALVSGGEGQRVRFGRAMLRNGIRLAILDEPARGLDHNKRQLLIERARHSWPGATVLCITHDVGDTVHFPRVLVIDKARVVEDDNPANLLAKPDSLYRSLIDAEESVRRGLWSSDVWRHIRMQDGRIQEQPKAGGAA